MPLFLNCQVTSLDTDLIITTYATSEYLDNPSWSPDNKYVVFGQTPDKYSGGKAQIILLNALSSEHTNLGYGYEPSFAKNENRIVAYKLTDTNLTSCCQIINLPGKTIEDVSVTQPIANIALSSDGKRIAAIMNKEYVNYLFLTDLQTSQQSTFNLPFTAEISLQNAIKWSPNGKLLSIGTVDPFTLTILDLSGNIRLTIEGVSNWEWANNGSEILYIKRYDKGCRKVEPYFYIVSPTDKQSTKIDFPPSIKNYLSQEIFEWACYVGIGSLTW